MDMHSAGLGGRLPTYIAELVKHRTLSVKIGNYVSERKVQQNRVPQGNVLSVTLFALKINNIIGQIPKDPHFHYSLYEDDLQIGYHHTDTNVIQRAIQQFTKKYAHGLVIMDLNSHPKNVRLHTSIYCKVCILVLI